MISLLDPRLWLVCLLGAVLTFAAGNFHGHKAEAKASALVAARADAAVSQAQADAVATVAAGKKAEDERLAAIEAKHQQENDDAKVKMDSLRNDVRTGAVRLSIATRAARQNTDAGNFTAAADNQETRSELVPAAAGALVSIASDGDGAMRDLNACIDAYNNARDSLAATAKALSK